MAKQQSKRKPQRRKPKPAANKLFPGEKADIMEELRELHDGYLERWLDTPHEWFMGRKPRDLIGGDDEIHLRNWLRMVKHGMFT